MVDYDALASQYDGAVDTTVHTKAFVGIISQGTLGAPQDFKPQESALMENIDQLQKAAHDNGARFFASLPSRLRYSIRFTNNFTKEDGSVETAATQEIVTGYSKKGVPHRKTIRNKFAIMTITLIGDQGQKHKVKDINLGPVDAATVNPTPFQLGNLTDQVATGLVTNDTADFHSVVSPTPTAVLNVPPEPVVPPTAAETHVALSLGLTPEQLLASGVKLATNYQEARDNLIPARLFYKPSQGPGSPAQIIIGVSPNVPFSFTEIDLPTAQNLIRSTPSNYIVANSDEVNALYGKLGINAATQDAFYRQVLIVGTLGDVRANADTILSGNLPASPYVWAYKGSDGKIETYVLLSDILAGKFS